MMMKGNCVTVIQLIVFVYDDKLDVTYIQINTAIIYYRLCYAFQLLLTMTLPSG